MTLFKPGTNCWRVEKASQAAYFIDSEAYYKAVKQAIEQATRSVFIVGWDIDSRTRLIRGKGETDRDVLFGELLTKALENNPELEIRILIWNYAFIKVMERELWVSYKLNWKAHPRLVFRWDGVHPLGASHHQKIVTIDDQLAFAGGIDLSKWRWDTPEHLADDPRRVDPTGRGYNPYHDVQLMVEGDAARALGDLARERWHKAGGERTVAVEKRLPRTWPAEITPHFLNADIAISRTIPEYRQQKEVREIEQLYLDAIQNAEHLIFIENQYTTSHTIGAALAARLQDKDGPEIIVVTHIESGGWLEQNTMDVIRSRWVRRLLDADVYNRFGIYYPHLPGYNSQKLTVHSKVMIVDNDFMRVGSSNLCNRSMGLDTECDLSIESGGDSAIENSIIGFRNQLLSEHLGIDTGRFEELFKQHTSLKALIESRQTEDRSLRPLDYSVPDWKDRQVPHAGMIDPEKAVDSDWFRDQWISEENSGNALWISLRFILLILFLLGMAAAWRWTPLSRFTDLKVLLKFIETWRENSSLTPLMVSGFIIGGCVGVPVTFMVTAMAIVFDPWKALALSYVSIILSSSLSFWIGNLAGREFIEKHAGTRVKDISRKIARQGILFLALIRLIPIAPFTIINTVGGASHVKFRDFLVGTLIGSIPGAIVVTFFVERLTIAARDPRPRHFIIAAAIGLAFVGGSWLFSRWVRGRSKHKGHL